MNNTEITTSDVLLYLLGCVEDPVRAAEIEKTKQTHPGFWEGLEKPLIDRPGVDDPTALGTRKEKPPVPIINGFGVGRDEDFL